ncbi:MAG TPA: MotA/TolQ/ExbB proton channel family protein [Isosphaeraceae bacterium]|jgi:biopolymer transport protein ExbB
MPMRTRLRASCRALALGLVLMLVPACSRLPFPSSGPAAEGAAAPSEPMPAESFLRWMARASGPIGLVILGMSFYLVAVVVWMGYHYRRAIALPELLVREVNDLLGQKRFSDAYQRLAADPSFLARTLAAGVRKLPAGLPAAQRAMEMTNDDITMEMEHRTTYLATVGTLGPMIGLVGTVYGMILSFRVMATAGATPQASQLAAGISTALFATLEGIALAVPAIALYAYFRNRIARLSLEVEIAAESYLEQFAPGLRSPHPLVPTAGQQRTAIGGPPTANG